MNATIAQVAKRARVSTGTVSNVLNGKAYVSEQTRWRVERTLRALHYRPNGIARSLRTRRTFTLGLVVLDLSNPFYPEVIKGVENTARSLGYKVVIFDAGYSRRNAQASANAIMDMRVDGALFTAGYGDRQAILRLRQAGIPVVIMDRDVHELPLPSVGIDNACATRQAIAHLIAHGHRRIGYLSEPVQIRTVRSRFAGYAKGLADHGIPLDARIVFIEPELRVGKIEHGYELMRRVIASGAELPTAFFATSDITAIGAMHALKDAGIAVPAGVSIVGFDDISLARYTDPPLTTVRQPKFEMGREAVMLLVDTLERRAPVLKKIVLDTPLVMRRSVAAPRA